MKYMKSNMINIIYRMYFTLCSHCIIQPLFTIGSYLFKPEGHGVSSKTLHADVPDLACQMEQSYCYLPVLALAEQSNPRYSHR